MKVSLKAHLARYKKTITTKTLVSVFVILFLILSASALIDYFSRRRAVIENMTHFSQLLANTIQKSTANSIYIYNLMEHYIESRLISNLKLLNNLELIRNFDNEYLKRFAAETFIFHINVYNQRGEREYSSHSERQCINIEKLIEPILQGKESELTLGIQSMQNQDEKIHVIALSRIKGGAIVGSITVRKLFSIQKYIGIEKYLNSIASDSSIIYIAIQDSNSITSGTQNLDSLSRFSSDELLRDVYRDNQFHWRISKFKNIKIFEALLPLYVTNKSYGIIRIGLDYSPVQKMQRDVLQHVLIRLIVLLIISFILFSYSISIQNIQLLEKEKQKITNEVYILQHDLRQKEKMSAVGELAAGIAHEIRNPLGAISMTVQRLAREFKPIDGEAKQKRLFDIIRKEIDHISASIKNLLQFSKPAPLQMSPNRLDKIIDKIVDLYCSKATDAGITLIWLNHTEVRAIIDPVKIEECLVNILENAITATPPRGKIEIGLKTTKREIAISVKDTGSGISQENISKIYNLYFTTKSDGTGLGLAHAHQIVSEHGGKIRVDSHENQGTIFTIILPNDNAN
ncbi:GHKL domain-containing protein [bacterium]|nr:GHKL domain-containing protein [bacterium]MBU1063472.1 GHKL domain-containing protein [bacterium]MBU1873090.1 GHKL domain-containing protein [bacterium]